VTKRLQGVERFVFVIKEALFSLLLVAIVFFVFKSFFGESSESELDGETRSPIEIFHKGKKALLAEMEMLDGRVAEVLGAERPLRSALQVTEADVEKCLRQGEFLVDFLKYRHILPKEEIGIRKDRYGAVLIGRGLANSDEGGGDPMWVPLGDADVIEGRLESLMESFDEAFGSGSKPLLRELHELVFAPVEKHLPKETKTLILSPDGSLNFLSFPSLIDRDGKFLCEKYDLLHVSSGRDLLVGQDNRNPPSGDAVFFADPSYDGKEESSSDSHGFLAFHPSTREAMRDLSFARLEGSKKEAEHIGRVVGRFGMRSNSLTGDQATEEALRKVHSPRILHLATHGFFIPEERMEENANGLEFFQEASRSRVSNPMRRSGLALAGAKRTLDLWSAGKPVDPGNDGILTAEEAGMLDLSDTWLTVLSACDTGTGVARAGEGVLGLRRAFAMAGTQNLLLTLWPVSDSFTKDFMVSFYEEALKTEDAPRAMAKVQRDRLVKLREERSIGQAVKLAGPFVLTFRGGLNRN
jgi:CHAT domain-containing protein